MLIGIGACFLFLGCSRAPELEFSPSVEVAELSEKHQSSVAQGLRRLFGTPTKPRLRVVDPEAEEPEEGQPWPLIDTASELHLQHGARVYNARCAGCHGVTGDGAGPAAEFLQPRPRDYRNGVYKFTSTPYGMKPVRQDLVRTIRRGAKGTSMPAFPWMSDEDLNAVIDYVILLSQRGEVEKYAILMSADYEEDEDVDFLEFVDALDSARESWDEAKEQVVVPLTAASEFNEENVVAGRKLFLSQGCASCHGLDGKGQIEWLNPEFIAKQEALPEGEREKINYDAWEEPAPAADLTARMLHGGRRPLDIYRRIYTGINGTPMPAFANAFQENPEDVWLLVHYVRHIIEGGDPIAGIPSLPKDPASEEAGDGQSSNEDSAANSTVPPASSIAEPVDVDVVST